MSGTLGLRVVAPLYGYQPFAWYVRQEGEYEPVARLLVIARLDRAIHS
jgi:hypothetical protein